jgi:uncharacterized membrane protein
MSDNFSNVPNGNVTDEKTYATIVHGLYLASYIFGITSIIGLVMAYLRRDACEDWARSHYVYAIRTFWIGLLYSLIGALLCFVLIGIPILIGVAVWFGVRSIIAILRAQKAEELPNPETWWI